MTGLTHFTEDGDAHMVDVGAKDITERRALAMGEIVMAAQTLALIREGGAKKGDVLGVARLAGIMAAKKTADLIPLCHPLPLSKITLDLACADEPPRVTIAAEVKVSGRTGVEMEALTAVSVAALTVYDMVKAADKTMVIGAIHLAEKDGGRSGSVRNPPPS